MNEKFKAGFEKISKSKKSEDLFTYKEMFDAHEGYKKDQRRASLVGATAGATTGGAAGWGLSKLKSLKGKGKLLGGIGAAAGLVGGAAGNRSRHDKKHKKEFEDVVVKRLFRKNVTKKGYKSKTNPNTRIEREHMGYKEPY